MMSIVWMMVCVALFFAFCVGVVCGISNEQCRSTRTKIQGRLPEPKRKAVIPGENGIVHPRESPIDGGGERAHSIQRVSFINTLTNSDVCGAGRWASASGRRWY